MQYIASQNKSKLIVDKMSVNNLSIGNPLYTMPNIGTNGQVLAVKSDLSGLEFVSQSVSGYKGFSVELSNTSSNTEKTLEFSTHTWDTENGLNDANDWYVIPIAGKWVFNLRISQPSDAVNQQQTIVIRNLTSAAVKSIRDYNFGIASNGLSNCLITVMDCSVNDTIRVSSSASSALNGDAVVGTFQGYYLGV